MFRYAVTALLLPILFGSPALAGDAPSPLSPEAAVKLLVGKTKPQVLEAAGTPDRMLGVGTTGEAPINLSQQWVYAPPRALAVTDPATGAKCTTLRVWFDPGDRVEKVIFEY